MERRVKVNDQMTSGRPDISPDGLPLGWSDGDWQPEEESDLEPEDAVSKAVASRREPRELGPCLYLGPSGQRCVRKALVGGFCAKHRIDGADDEGAGRGKNWARVLAATGAIVALLWPYVQDLVHEIMRWAHRR